MDRVNLKLYFAVLHLKMSLPIRLFTINYTMRFENKLKIAMNKTLHVCISKKVLIVANFFFL